MNGMVYLVMCCKPDDADKQDHLKKEWTEKQNKEI